MAIERKAKIMGNRDRLETIQRYMPSNYRAYADDDGKIFIVGRDVAGWTLDGYVIPRLGSGLIAAREVPVLNI